MKLNHSSTHRLQTAAAFGLALAALACWGLLIWHAWALYPQTGWFNSDAATELLYARHMAQTGQLLPGEWYFTTEMRLLHSSLVMAPLFTLTDSFALVHTVTVAIVTALQYAAALALLRGLRLSWPMAMAGGLLALCPISLYIFDYFQSTLYYSFFWLCSMLLWALAARWPRPGWQGRVLLAAGCLLAFVMGLCGIRYLEILFLPLAGVAALRILGQGLRRADAWRAQSGRLALCACGAGGYAAVTLLQRAGILPSGQMQPIQLYAPAQWPEKLKECLLAYGSTYFGGGIGSKFSLLLWEALAFSVIWLFCRRRALEQNQRDYGLFCILLNAVNLVILTVVKFDSPVPWRYTLLPNELTWMLLPLAPADLLRLRHTAARRASAVLTAVLVAGLALNTWQVTVNFPLQTALARCRAEAVRYIEEAGWQFGYATYWNANVITCMSECRVTVAPVNLDAAEGIATPLPMGCPHSFFQAVPGQTPEFLLLSAGEADASGDAFGSPVYENDCFAVYPYSGPVLQIS